MPTKLKLYEEPLLSALDKESPRELNPDCSLCPLSGLPEGCWRENGKFYIKERRDKGSREFVILEIEPTRRVPNVCMEADGSPGGLLVVGSKPTLTDNKTGPFRGKGSAYVRSLVRKHYKGPIAYDYAVRCPGSISGAGKSVKPSAKHADACRGYLKSVFNAAQPDRIFVFGPLASYGVLGRSPPALSLRKAYGWVHNDGDPIPVFIFPSPEQAYKNRFIKEAIYEDIKWACEVDREELLKTVEPVWNSVARLVTDAESARESAKSLRKNRFFSWDLETVGAMFRSDFKVICIGFSGSDENDSWVWTREAMVNEECIEILRELMEDPKVLKTEHNGLYDRQALKAAYGIDVRGTKGDTLYWKKMLDTESDGRLEVCQELVGLGGSKEENEEFIKETLSYIRKKSVTEEELKEVFGDELMEHVLRVRYPSQHDEGYKQHIYGLVDRTVLYRYCARDSKSTAELTKLLQKEMKKAPEVCYAWKSILQEASEQIVQVQAWGILVDQEKLDAFTTYLQEQEAEIRKRLSKWGEDFNPGSARQLSDLLFRRLCLPVHKRSKKTNEPSTDAASLEKLRGTHEVVDDILKLRLIEKMRGTYAEGMRKHIRDDGRIHPSFRLDGTRTGRLSCTSPNLQNIPRSSSDNPLAHKLGSMAKNVFVAPEGRLLLQLDYGQLELRIATMMSEDPEMLKIWLSGEDYHMGTARLIAKPMWGITDEQWNAMSEKERKPYRSAAKAFNFGLLYGMTDYGMAQRIGCSKEEARSLRHAILGTFTRLDQWCQDQVETAKQYGYVWTVWNGKLARRRQLFDIGSIDDKLVWKAQNAAINCLDAETEALTKRGWVKGFDLTKDDELLTKNPSTGSLEWQKPTDIRLFPDYYGKVIEFQSEDFLAITTPDHRWLVTDKHTGLVQEETSSTISKHGDHLVHRTGVFDGRGLCDWPKELIHVAGAWLVDGYLAKEGVNYPTLGLRFGLSETSGRRRVAERSLERLGVNHTISEDIGTDAVCIEFESKACSKILEELPNRELTPKFVQKLSSEQARVLLDAMAGGPKTGDILCASETQASSIQILATLCGIATSLTVAADSYGHDGSPFRVWKVAFLDKDSKAITAEETREYHAKVGVWCPIVPNTFFVARRSGHVFVTGNTPVQGSASDYCLKSLTEITKWLRESNFPAKLVVTVHDSIILEVDEDKVEELHDKAKGIMEGWYSGDVPLEADAEVGKSWGDLIPYSEWLKTKQGK